MAFRISVLLKLVIPVRFKVMFRVVLLTHLKLSWILSYSLKERHIFVGRKCEIQTTVYRLAEMTGVE